MNNSQQKTDSELVLLTLQHEDYFLYLVQRYEAKLARYIHRITGFGKEDIEDLLQEIFLKIYLNLNDFDTNLNFSSWAYRITHNEAVNCLKKNSKRKTVSLETDEEDIVSLIEVLKSDVDIPKETAQKELAEKVRGIIYSMPEKYRDALVLRFLEDKDYSEISDILKKPIGTVSVLINRAKEYFKKLAEKNNLQSLFS
jgi:RNA polymerase sigma-70 factor (ECF subfamily)